VAGKVIVPAGASDGIGAAAARKLVADGHTVAVAGRSAHKRRALAQEPKPDHFLADFAGLADVRAFGTALTSADARIDVVVSHAGGIFGGSPRTVDGFEKTLQVNYFAPFLLTNLLMDPLGGSNASIASTASVGAGDVREGGPGQIEQRCEVFSRALTPWPT
jgi:NAD(P)-dependent dehydrogenase (short-subunit alcohol dehydrogenase family)